MPDTNTQLVEITDYISQFEDPVRARLNTIRNIIQCHAGGASEIMSNGLPGFILNGHLIAYAAFREHIGFYPTSGAIKAFKTELRYFQTSTGTLRLPHDQDLPEDLIAAMVQFRFTESAEKV